ncbi:MAG: two-component system LytT family response regulator [Paraglaciecola sp.]|jgi:two-component system LytT family response regulator|uniref:LytR/AlgR family response regulator transcription factor n=1 Tax=Polaribacter sp. TaxID=1920175 RepID=UPI003ADDE8BD
MSSVINENLIALPNIHSIEFVDTQDILYLEADGNYTIFHLVDNITKVVSKNIGGYEKVLPINFFFRIHHKYIINFNKVSLISKTDGYYCELNNGEALPVAKRRQEELRKFLKLK